MTVNYRSCSKCQGRGKIRLSIGKRARRKYKRRLSQFEQGYINVERPKELVPHVDICEYCAGSGLVCSETPVERDTKNYPHVAIIGGGIGGVAFALACLHRGIPYTLYERDESFDSRSQGYGLTLQQASNAIKGLGIFELANGITSTRHVVHDPKGKIIGEWGRRKLSPEEMKKPTKRKNVHISRQELRAELLAGLKNDPAIKWGYCLQNISAHSTGQYQLEFQTAQGQKTATADLIVGADGIRSCVRSLSLQKEVAPLQYLGCIVILGICPLEKLPHTQDPLLDSTTVFQTVNGHERIYMMPYNENNIMWQLSFPMPEKDAKGLSKNGSQALKQEALKRLGSWHSPIPEILKSTDNSLISGYPVYDREPLNPDILQNFGNTTLLGDAMHPMSPFKGQGANQALLDALDLARDIATKCTPESGWKEKGLRKILLEDFEKQMLERSTLKVRDSARAVKMLHSKAVMHDGEQPRGRGF